MVRLVFTSSPGLVSWVIRKLTGGRASHVGIQLGPDEYLHADRGGVRLDDRGGFLLGGERTVVAAYEAKPEVEPFLTVGYARSCVGQAYDYAGLVGFLFPILSWRWFRRRASNPLGSPAEYVCSEFVLRALDWDRVVPELRGDPEAVHPALLMRRVAHGRSFRKCEAP